MAFAAGIVRVSDVESVRVFSVTTGRSRQTGHGISIYADDPDVASRIDVLIDAGDSVARLTAVPGYELPLVRGIPVGGLPPADELGLILDGHDRPLARLTAAVKLVLAARSLSPPNRAAAVNSHRAQLIGEWMRGVAVPMRAADAALASVIDKRVADQADTPVDDPDSHALDLTATLLRAAGLQLLGPAPGGRAAAADT
jgi:hypothetical protein